MRRISRFVAALAAGLGLAGIPPTLWAENLGDAWAIALGVNQQLQAQQAQSGAAGLNLSAAKSARLPTVRNFTFNAFLTAAPYIQNPFTSTTATGGSSGRGAGTTNTPGATTGSVPTTNAGVLSGLPSVFPVLGPGQRDLPFSLTYAAVPLYTGGRILRSIDAAGAQVGAQRSEEFRTALDLKLTVAEAYVGVLRAQKDLQVARTNVEQLASFARDVKNRREQGLALRSDELAASVSLANGQLGEIQATTALEAAWATYNRYLCRPLKDMAFLEELNPLTPTGDPTQLAQLALEAVRASTRVSALDEAEVAALTDQAFRIRPELAGLSEQARGLAAQAAAARAGVRPQAGFAMAFVYLGNNNSIPQGFGAATFYVDWTITDGGASRRRSAALRQQEVAALRRRADTADDIALQVRTRWLDLRQSRQRVPVSRLAVVQAEENINVVTERYREQVSTYTEVLDAETRRIQSLTNFYHALYDESLALFRLHRAVGDL
ncbi:MAG: TolC family protein [Singulisphaera sp.]|nr:TolC family protein [Singulisphaera sp.]